MARFYLVRGTSIVGAIDAESKKEAERILGWRFKEGDTSYVVSAASWALGMPKRLPSNRCTSCGQRSKKVGYDRCEHCILLHRQETARERKANAPVKAPSRRPEQIKTGSGLERARQATIRRALEARVAKRRAG